MSERLKHSEMERNRMGKSDNQARGRETIRKREREVDRSEKIARKRARKKERKKERYRVLNRI